MEPTATLRVLPNPRALLDEVIYLASLASDRQMIDPIMDTVRNITANLQGNSVLSTTDQAGLQRVRDQLIDHLVHRDKLRSFTEQELEQQVAETLGTASKKYESLWMVAKILLLAAAAYPIGVLVMYTTKLPQPLLLAGAFSTTTLYAGLIWLYVSSLATFTAELRTAYRWLCGNMLSLCAAAVCSTFLNAFPSVGHLPLLSYGEAVVYIGLLAALIGYQGMRRFARAIELRSRFASWPIVLSVLFVIGTLAYLLPHASVPDLFIFRFMGFLWLLVGGFSLSVAIIGFKIAHRVTERYARAISWFSIAYVQAALISFAVLAMIYALGPIYAGVRMLGIEFAMATCGISLVIAGYKFSRSVGKS